MTTGAIMIPMAASSAIGEAFAAVDAPMNMVETTGRMRYRLPHGDFDLPLAGGGLYAMIEFAFEGHTEKAQHLCQQIRDALADIPGDELTFRDWLDLHTDNNNVKNLFQGFCAALMGTNLHEIPAGEYFRFLKYSSRGSRFGLAAEGNGELMGALGSAIESRGSHIQRRAHCHGIEIDDGRAAGVVVKSPDGGDETIRADWVLSNTGPDRTVELAGGRSVFDAGYLRKLDAAPHDAPILHISFVSDQPLIEGFDGSLVFGNNKNLIYLEIPSLISPRLAPEGKYLHTAYGAPRDATNADLKADMQTTLAELKSNFPGQLEGAEYLVRARHHGQSPGMHRWAGHMLPVETSIPNLFNVGDGSTTPGTIGTEGAASSAREAVRQILSA